MVSREWDCRILRWDKSSVIFQLLAVTAKISCGLSHGIAAEFLQSTARKCQSYHGLGSNSGGGDYTNVGTLVGGLHRFARGKVNGLQWTAKGRNWFQIAAHADFLSIGDAAFNASSIISCAGESSVAGSGSVADFVVHRRADGKSRSHAGADFYRLNRLQ